MTRLDRMIERLRALPAPQQERLAAEIEVLIEEAADGPALTDAQWAEVERALADPTEPTIGHDALMRALAEE